MSEYVDKHALMVIFDDAKYAKPDNDFQRGVNAVVDWLLVDIKQLPIADVVEVRRGSWIVTDADDGMCENYDGFIEFKCSECDLSVGLVNGEYDWYYGDPIPWKYCPICGAKMDGEGSKK